MQLNTLMNTPIKLVTGQRCNILNLTESSHFQCVVDLSQAGLPLDVFLFGLDGDGNLADEQYLIYYNQTRSPDNSLVLNYPQEGISCFDIHLDALATWIEKLLLVVTVEGAGTLGQIRSATLRLEVHEQVTALFEWSGDSCRTEQVIVFLQFYKRGQCWRLAVSAEAQVGQISDFIEARGGVIERQSIAIEPPFILAEDTSCWPLPAGNITLLGGRGVGKTSLLATLYGQFEYYLAQGFNLQLTLDQRTHHLLTDKLGQLQSAVEDEIVQGILTGDTDRKSYHLLLGLPLKQPELRLILQDYPGGWLKQVERIPEVIHFLQNSSVILWVVDTAALMVRGSKQESYSTLINQPLNVKNIFVHALSNHLAHDKKLVLFVPVKSESWTDEIQGAAEVCKQIEQDYAPILNLIRTADGYGKRFTVAIAPVHTLGGVRFDRLETRENSQPYFIYKRLNGVHSYAPRYGDMLLMYCLYHIMHFCPDVSVSTSLKESLKNAMKTCFKQQHAGFKILHGRLDH